MLISPAAVCPRCGIEHHDYQRARRHVLCVDCRGYGTGWAQKARDEVDQLTRAEQPRYCRKGLHQLTDDNLYLRPDGRGHVCLACKREGGRRRAA